MDEPIGVAAMAEAAPAKTALVAGARRVSFADLDANANRLARALRARGVGPDDRVCIAIANEPEWFEASTAVARLGAEVVPVAWRAKTDEVAYLIADSGAAVSIGAQDTPGVDLRVGSTYEQARDAEDASPLPDAVEPAVVRFRYYTSGTTGRAKAVVRADPGYQTWLANALRLTEFWGVASPDDVHLVCGPLYHTGPCAYGNYALLRGQTVVIMERFDAEECLRLIEQERVTWTHMVPINFVRILRAGAAGARDLSSLRRVLHAAAPCPVDVKRAIMDVFPPGVVWEYYGMTEGFGSVISPEDWERKPGSVGRAMPGGRITIRDAAGNALPAGETGLVYVTGSGFSYAGDEEKTAAAWREDEFTVGDMGYLDEDGFLFLTDRAHDMVITGGANVYPAEVEAVLYRHPAVADCAVIGIPDEEFGEQVHAIVERSADVSEQDLIEHCRDLLAHHKCPRSIAFVERLPREENGKIRKRVLREPYWAGRDRRI